MTTLPLGGGAARIGKSVNTAARGVGELPMLLEGVDSRLDRVGQSLEGLDALWARYPRLTGRRAAERRGGQDGVDGS